MTFLENVSLHTIGSFSGQVLELKELHQSIWAFQIWGQLLPKCSTQRVPDENPTNNAFGEAKSVYEHIFYYYFFEHILKSLPTAG